VAFGWPTVKVGGCDGFEREREREISEREFGREREMERKLRKRERD